VPAAATPARRINSPIAMRIAAATQCRIVGCAGTSSATRRNGTGSQLRLRNRTPPMRAAGVCSAADVAGELVTRET
jgi:hypothetical protein